MLRHRLIISAVATVVLLPLGAGAQSKDRAKDKSAAKICANVTDSQAAMRNGCPVPRASNGPTQLRIGGSSFGSGGSTNTGGSTSNIPHQRNPAEIKNQPHFVPGPRR
jgi:hypothetical protein